MLAHQLKAVAFAPDLRTTFWDSPLDHVYSRGVEIISAQSSEVTTSDHNPLVVTLRFSPQDENARANPPLIPPFHTHDRQ